MPKANPVTPSAKYNTTCKNCDQILLRQSHPGHTNGWFHAAVDRDESDHLFMVGWTEWCDEYFVVEHARKEQHE